MKIERYCPVKSLAGHDKNQYYIVISDEGESVTMANGTTRKVDDPTILHAMKESYKQQFGVEPAVKVIHAGLECGIIGAIIPGLDMISFGPTLRSPHSPDERALIPTVQKFYDFLVATLAQTPTK